MKKKQEIKTEFKKPEKSKVLCIIPARAGSKGIPNKNFVTFNGKPLIRWTIDRAIESKAFDRVVVSTESEEYKQFLDLWYKDANLVPFHRPDNLAGDAVPTYKVILHVLEKEPGYDTIVLLEPTSPIRCGGDINAALDLYYEKGAKAVVSVCESHRCHPAISFELGKDLRCLVPDTPSPRRQELRPYYHQTGLIYIADVEWYKKHETFLTADTIGYKVQPWQDAEIDDDWDLDICGALMRRTE